MPKRKGKGKTTYDKAGSAYEKLSEEEKAKLAEMLSADNLADTVTPQAPNPKGSQFDDLSIDDMFSWFIQLGINLGEKHVRYESRGMTLGVVRSLFL